MRLRLRSASPRARSSERGVALLLTLFVVLIVAVIVVQLAVTTSAEYAVSNNVTTIAKLDAALDSALIDARKALTDDAQSSSSGDSTGGAMPGGMPSNPGGSSGAGGDGSGAASSDSFNDTWSSDQETSIGDVSVTVHIEDENRKFNVLSLVSKDPDYARLSLERLVRIIDMMREVEGGNPQYDIETSQAEKIANGIKAWVEGSDRRGFPRPDFLSNQTDSPIVLPLTIDELLFVEGIDTKILYDFKAGGFVYPGLASILTVWTSLEAGPTSPDGTAQNSSSGTTPPGQTPTNGNNSNNNNNQAAGGANGTGGTDGPATAGKPKDPSIASGKSNGVKININTAPPCVLKGLAPTYDIPADVIDALIRYRNTLDEDKLNSQKESGEINQNQLPSGVDEATKMIDRSALAQGEVPPPAHIFETVDDLNKVDEWKSYTNDAAKKEFLKLITTQSDVFSIYITARPSSGFGASDAQRMDAFEIRSRPDGTTDPEEVPGGVVKRIRQVVWRRAGKQDASLLSILVRQERYDRKCSIPDYQPDPTTGKPRFH